MEARDVTLLVDLGVTKELQGRLESCAKPRKAENQGASGLSYFTFTLRTNLLPSYEPKLGTLGR